MIKEITYTADDLREDIDSALDALEQDDYNGVETILLDILEALDG